MVISTNQAVGSFSTTITIPNQEKIYYFRSVAENAGGTVVSRSLGVFTPSAVVGVSDLSGRWSFDDANFSIPDKVLPLKSQVFSFGWMLLIPTLLSLILPI